LAIREGKCQYVIEVEFSLSNLDPLGRKNRGNPGSGGEGFLSHSAVVVGHCFLVRFFVEKARSEDHHVSRGQGELLRGQRLRTANQGASCGALQLEKFNPSDWKGPGR
jgi:hypothetical protein